MDDNRDGPQPATRADGRGPRRDRLGDSRHPPSRKRAYFGTQRGHNKPPGFVTAEDAKDTKALLDSFLRALGVWRLNTFDGLSRQNFTLVLRSTDRPGPGM